MSGQPETAKDVNAAGQPAPRKTPGRTLGFSLMSLMIVFAGYWLAHESSMPGVADLAGPQQEAPALAGFNAEQWFLPADALLGFVAIPAGPFTMGSNPALDAMAYENERWSATRRQGEVNLPAYYMSRFEVTVAQFRAYVRESGASIGDAALDQPGNYPVSNITWAEALAYSRWLEQQLRQSTQTPAALRQLLDAGAHVTLPTEAEWEKAARGTDARVFPWGSQPTSQFANFGSDGVAAVGSRECPDCSYGLLDMSGNVWELTRSPLQDYPYDAADDFKDLASDPLYVMRGGSYSDAINNVRAAVRGGVDPGVRSPTIGFRVAISTL